MDEHIGSSLLFIDYRPSTIDLSTIDLSTIDSSTHRLFLINALGLINKLFILSKINGRTHRFVPAIYRLSTINYQLSTYQLSTHRLYLSIYLFDDHAHDLIDGNAFLNKTIAITKGNAIIFE
jgi:hypothetical protein